MPVMRLGVIVSPLKARIIDAVQRASPDGISGAALINDIGIPLRNRRLVAVHVWQINEQLAATDYRITGRGRGYRIMRRRVAP
jgi:hypothetical protein